MQFSSKRGPFRHLPFLAAVAALAILVALLISPGPVSDPAPGNSTPRLALGLTAQARQNLQTANSAFPKEQAGFSAYYRVPQGSGGYGLDKAQVDDGLHKDQSSSLLRLKAGELQDMGQTHTVTTLSILNVGGLTTEVNLYYDDQGWLVAYFDRDVPSSQVWQAAGLGEEKENPTLTDVSHTVLLNAINAVVDEILFSDPITPEGLGYYHWGYPTANKFLLIASARGDLGEETVSFAVPPGFNVHEVSFSWWYVEGEPSVDDNEVCANVLLDDAPVGDGPQCVPGWSHHRLSSLDAFNSRTAHTMTLEQSGSNYGSSGVLAMLVYSTE